MSLLQVNTIRNKNGNSAPTLDLGLNVSGVSTLGTVKVSSGIVTATSGIVTYYGDAQYLQNVGAAITSIPTDLIVSGILTVTNLNSTGNISVANTISAGDITSSGSLSVGSSITGSTLYGNGVNLTGIVTSLVAGSNISLSGSSGRVTVSATIPASGLYNIVEDTTPQLGGDLDLNSKNITGSGNINAVGVITASSFVGNVTGNIIGNVTGTATTASHTTITNDTTSSTNNYITFVSATSGNRPQKVSSTGMIFNPLSKQVTFGGALVVGNINSVGVITATDFNSSSDINLKENIKVIENATSKVQQLSGISFNWKENKKPAIGVIAQEVQSVFPELVNKLPNGTLTVNYDSLIAVLIESVKELKQEIEELKSNK
jgi:hypothetical protein